ncbi:MAG: NADH-quinone oxidoreductase subunit M, partial [Pseudomonadota bacterium]|nr:NADH-quinone oxidoreductase subunit M [Pseudomonadota bacterium]
MTAVSTGLPLLSILIALPLVAGMVCLFVGANAARWIALVTTLVLFAIGIGMWLGFNPDGPQWQFVENVSLGSGLRWALGIDGIALMLTMLTLFLMPICIGAS